MNAQWIFLAGVTIGVSVAGAAGLIAARSVALPEERLARELVEAENFYEQCHRQARARALGISVEELEPDLPVNLSERIDDAGQLGPRKGEAAADAACWAAALRSEIARRAYDLRSGTK